MSAAWAVVFEWVRTANRAIAEGAMTAETAAARLAAWKQIDAVLNVSPSTVAQEAPAAVVALLQARQDARKAKDFKRSDTLRDEIKAQGWIIDDTPKGPKLKRC
jgi:cysteinyl-tRNA synthetase